MKFIATVMALAATSVAMPNGHTSVSKQGNVCDSKQTVVCQGGNGGLLSLGNVLPGALGQSCSSGDVYCCSHDDVQNVGELCSPYYIPCSMLTALL